LCAEVFCAISGVTIGCIALIGVFWLIGHVVVSFDVMSVQRDLRGAGIGIVFGHKIAFGFIGVVFGGSLLGSVGMIGYFIYGTFADSLAATQQELDIERQQTASD
jgi:hypothetical protein